MTIAAVTDHFTSILSANWDTDTAGSGTASVPVGESFVEFDTGGTSDAAILISKGKLDKTENHHFTFWVRKTSGADLELIQLVDSITQPNTGLRSALEGERRFSVSFGGGTIKIQHDADGDGSPKYWDESAGAWTAEGVSADAADCREGATADWYVVNVYVKGTTISVGIEHQDRLALTNHEQGLREIARTTDLDLDTDFTAGTDDLWLVLGYRYSDDAAAECQIEKGRIDKGDVVRAATNDTSTPTDYKWMWNDSVGGKRFFRRGRTSEVNIPSEAWEDGSGRRKGQFLQRAGVIENWREGLTTGGSETGRATATSPDGPWTNDGGNPIILPSDFERDRHLHRHDWTVGRLRRSRAG